MADEVEIIMMPQFIGFQRGDQVRCVTHQYVMTVAAIQGDGIDCTWYDKDWKKQNLCRFHAHDLVNVTGYPIVEEWEYEGQHCFSVHYFDKLCQPQEEFIVGSNDIPKPAKVRLINKHLSTLAGGCRFYDDVTLHDMFIVVRDSIKRFHPRSVL